MLGGAGGAVGTPLALAREGGSPWAVLARGSLHHNNHLTPSFYKYTKNTLLGAERCSQGEEGSRQITTSESRL